MALISGSVEIKNEAAGSSDGLVVNTPNVGDLPTALSTLRGLTGFERVNPVPTMEQEIGTFIYRQVEDGMVRDFKIETVKTPIADAMWTAKTAGGAEVEVLFRETRTLTPDQMDAARALAEIQEQRRFSER